jgi:hypothetical protein
MVTVLGLVAVVALLSAGALHDALFGEQLATSRLLHQRAIALADLGIEQAMDRLAGPDAPVSQGFALQPLPPSTDSVRVDVRHLGTTPLAKGYSFARFVRHDLQIESTGHTSRGFRMTQVQGVTRVLPDETTTASSGSP